jgi:hypothetical protein
LVGRDDHLTPSEQIGMQPIGHDQQADIREIAGR